MASMHQPLMSRLRPCFFHQAASSFHLPTVYVEALVSSLVSRRPLPPANSYLNFVLDRVGVAEWTWFPSWRTQLPLTRAEPWLACLLEALRDVLWRHNTTWKYTKKNMWQCFKWWPARGWADASAWRCPSWATWNRSCMMKTMTPIHRPSNSDYFNQIWAVNHFSFQAPIVHCNTCCRSWIAIQISKKARLFFQP
jgi:hypothetical protein